MLRYLLFFGVLFSGLLLFYPPHDRLFAPAYQTVEHWRAGTAGQTSFNGIYDPLAKTAYFRDGSSLVTEDLLALPLFGPGYFTYNASGKTVSFHAASGELFWKRDLRGYPRPHPSGGLTLILSSDNTRVSVLDADGAVESEVQGVMLMDYAFAASSAQALLLFSDGRLIIAGGGKSIEHTIPRQGFFFAKSAALSSDGLHVAIHALDADKDQIILLRLSKDRLTEKGRVPLSKVYPHTIQMAVEQNGLLLGLPDRTEFYLQGKRKFERPLSNRSLYRALLSTPSLFLFAEDEATFVLDGSGSLLLVYGRSSSGPTRFTANGELFAEETREGVVFRSSPPPDKLK